MGYNENKLFRGGIVVDKNTIVGIGLVGLPFLCVGTMIGNIVSNKINDKYCESGINVWKTTAEFLKEQLIREYQRNDDLKKELRSKKEA